MKMDKKAPLPLYEKMGKRCFFACQVFNLMTLVFT